MHFYWFFQREWPTFLLPLAFFTNVSTYKFLLTSYSRFLNEECYFLLFTFSFRYSWCAFLSNLPIDFVEFWATPNCAVSYFFFYLYNSTFCFLFSIILCLRDILCFGLSSLSLSFYTFSPSSAFLPFLTSLTFRSMKWAFGFFIFLLCYFTFIIKNILSKLLNFKIHQFIIKFTKLLNSENQSKIISKSKQNHAVFLSSTLKWSLRISWPSFIPTAIAPVTRDLLFK